MREVTRLTIEQLGRLSKTMASVGEVCDCTEVAIDALEKQEKYRWHDLRKNPDDLPPVNPTNSHEHDVELYVAYANNKHPNEYHLGHLNAVVPYSAKNESGEDNVWGMPTYDSNWFIWGWSYFFEPIVIAWRYIDPFEEVE